MTTSPPRRPHDAHRNRERHPGLCRGVRDVVTTCRIIDAEATGIVDTTSGPSVLPGRAALLSDAIARKACRLAMAVCHVTNYCEQATAAAAAAPIEAGTE